MSDENNENQEESFPLEKILKTSIKDYCNNVSRKMNNYKLMGIHVYTTDKNIFQAFAAKVPLNAEAVVEFSYDPNYTNGYDNYASGVALIPKEKKDEEKNE